MAKSYTLSIGIENPSKLSSEYKTLGNPRVDIDYIYYFNKIGIGYGLGANYININNVNYLLTTSLSFNTALKLVEKETYTVYSQINVGYPYNFVTTYHNEDSLQYLSPIFYYEFKLGLIYNNFNGNVGITTTYLNSSENNVVSGDSLSRISVNLGYLVY